MTDFALPLPVLRRGRTVATGHGGRRTASFGDLVHAHTKMATSGATVEAEQHYDGIRRLFEAEHGKIVDDHWPKCPETGLALCCKKDRWGREHWSLHRSMGDLATGRPAFSSLLLHTARESVRASNVLCGMTQRIAVANLFALNRDIMASLAGERRARTAPAAFHRNLRDINRYSGEAGARQAQVIYLKGLLIGLLALVALAPLVGQLLPPAAVPDSDASLFAGCLVAGAFGATMSVLIRMSGGKFDVNHEVGRGYVTNLGFARPYIGAVFALLLYFASQGGLLHQVSVPGGSARFAFFVAAGFLIGFSERFAKEIVRGAESGAGGPGQGSGAGGEDPPPAKRTPKKG
ncbi:MAG: hypothetical protein ACXWLM_08590 [Myxococcales bacterium]